MTRIRYARAAIEYSLKVRGLKATTLAVNALAESLRYSDPEYLGDTDTLLAGLLLSGSYTVDVLEQAGADRAQLHAMTLDSVRGAFSWDSHVKTDALAYAFTANTAGAELLARAQMSGAAIDASDILRVALTLDVDDHIFADSAAAFPREIRRDAPPTSPLLNALEDRLCELLLFTASYLSAPQKPTTYLRRRTRPISDREDALIDKEFGSLFDGMMADELEFIIRAMNGWFVSRHLLLHPAALCLQTVNRCAQLLFGPRFVAESGGDLAAVEAGLSLARRLAPSSDDPFLALFQKDGRIYAEHFTYRQSLLVPNMAKDRSHHVQGVRLYAPRPMPIVSPDILSEFSHLISLQSPDQASIYDFLHAHPDIVESLGYCRAVPRFCLRDVEARTSSPDFVLDIPGRQAHAFLRLSSPSVSPIVRDPFIRASSELLRAVSHLRMFGSHFESRQHRMEIEKEYGMSGFRPEVIVVMGRSSVFHGEADRMSLDAQLENGVRLLTYDEVISYAAMRSLPLDVKLNNVNLGLADISFARSPHVSSATKYDHREHAEASLAGAWSSSISEYKGRIRAAIVTIKVEEEDAVLRKFPTAHRVAGRRSYNLSKLDTNSGSAVTVATVRMPRQGNLEAQAVVSDIIEDLAPMCVLLVGIAGASPFADAVLGDVVFGTYVHDLTVALDGPDGTREFAGAGGHMTERAIDLVTHLRPVLQDAVTFVGGPALDIDALEFTTTDETLNNTIRERLHDRFKAVRQTRLLPGPIMSSDALVKNPALARKWCETRRDALAIDMEFAGAYRASRARSSDLIAIRGISDIVGLKKREGWVVHACMVAAEFAHGLVVHWEPSGVGAVREPISAPVLSIGADNAWQRLTGRRIELEPLFGAPNAPPPDRIFCVQSVTDVDINFQKESSQQYISLPRHALSTPWGLSDMIPRAQIVAGHLRFDVRTKQWRWESQPIKR